MGTSSSNRGTAGKGTPLVPSWVDGDQEAVTPAPGLIEPTGAVHPPTDVPQILLPPVPIRPPIPPAADPRRFFAARSNFSRFARSGGSDHASLARAVASYVSRSSGGPRQATKAMGVSRAVAARLLGFLVDSRTRGSEESLRSLKLESLIGRPIEDIFLGFADYACPASGTVDAGVAREAFTQTIIELADYGITNLDGLTADQMQTVFELFVTQSIELRLYNDIGLKAIALPATEEDAVRLQRQVREFIQNGVGDALTQARANVQVLTERDVAQFVTDVYHRAFSLLETPASLPDES